ncbi:MAG: hypothetical protein ACLFMT_05215, partial [Halobacteriales archaeon]
MSTQTRVVPRDVAALVAVPVVLVAVHLLPQSLRVDLMLNYGSPSVLTMYTTHFVHANWGHLAGNVGVYLVAVSLSYALFVYAGSKSQFFTGFAAVLLLAPLPLSAFDLYMLGSEAGDVYSRGFSGLAAAYVGFLPVAVFVFLGNELSDRLKPHESMGLFLLSLGVVLLTYSGPMEPATWLAFVTGGLYYVH